MKFLCVKNGLHHLGTDFLNIVFFHRSIITTKCADECKMWKAKLKKKKSKRSENFENIPPEENDNFEHKPITL